MWSTLKPGNAGKTALLALLCGFPWCLSHSPAAAQTPEPAAVSTSPEMGEVAVRLLHMALHESVWGPPVHCRIRQQIKVYDQQISGFGTYVRAGQGSGKLKLNLQLAAGDSINVLRQISDGQLLHTLESISGKAKRTIIDLDKIRDRLVINNETVYDPKVAMYLAIGGQAESIRKLCLQYVWDDVKAGQLGKVPVWFLRGKLATEPAPIRSDTIIDSELFAPNQSALLPTQVLVAIGKPEQDDAIRYWLHRAEFRRLPEEPSPQGYTADLELVTEWADPRLIAQALDSQMFDAGTSNDPLLEETQRYLPMSSNIAQQTGSGSGLAVNSLADQMR